MGCLSGHGSTGTFLRTVPFAKIPGGVGVLLSEKVHVRALVHGTEAHASAPFRG